MNNEKETDLLRRRNISLSQELEEVKFKYWELENLNSESAKKAKSLITELESIKAEWLEVLDDLHNKQDECNKLLSALKEMSLIMNESEPKKRETKMKRFHSKLQKN